MQMKAAKFRAAGLRAVAAAAALAIVACDTEVSNPGPVQEPFLETAAAQSAVVQGMGRSLAQAINWLAYTGAAVTREVHPSGSTGSFGITVQWQRGELDPQDDGLDTHWEQAQRARWFAEDGIARMERVAKDSTRLLAQSYLYAGYANRLLGEHMCQAVIDGGGLEAHTVFFDRALGWFNKAEQAGTGDVRTAAIAGRASVYVNQGKWAEADADAKKVATSFRYAIPYFDVGSEAQRNRIQWASANQPYRAHTQWNTVYEAYFKSTNDPRVKWRTTTQTGDAAIDCCGRVPWWPQEKHATPAAAINLSSGAEMRLIEAENLLRGGNWQQAMVLINGLRTAAGVAPWTTTSLEQAWTQLKRERGIVLWLEGRRMADMRRWKAANTPGAHDPLELPSGSAQTGSHLVKQDLCFPVSKSERDTNSKIS